MDSIGINAFDDDDDGGGFGVGVDDDDGVLWVSVLPTHFFTHSVYVLHFLGVYYGLPFWISSSTCRRRRRPARSTGRNSF